MIGPNHAKRYALFLKRLKQARHDAGLTQVETSRLLGITQSMLSKCERGERRLDVVELEAFARIYKKPITYFVPPDRPSR